MCVLVFVCDCVCVFVCVSVSLCVCVCVSVSQLDRGEGHSDGSDWKQIPSKEGFLQSNHHHVSAPDFHMHVALIQQHVFIFVPFKNVIALTSILV